MDLAAQMIETQLFPTDWIYDNIFHLSEDQYDEYRDLIKEDTKRKFRLTQIESEGNDPQETGKSYGTPHDLASLYGKGRMESNPDNVPDGYNEKKTLGRPKEKASNIGKQDNNFGKDRLGRDGMKNDYNTSNPSNSSTKNSSPLALENSGFLKYKNMLKSIPTTKKQMVFEQDEKNDSLLDESNIKE